MDMMNMNMGGGGDDAPLNHTDVDFSDPDQQAQFLADLLDDTDLQVTGLQYAVYFWYGIAVLMTLATAFHWARFLTLKMRLKYAAANRATPAKPKSPWHKVLATATAIGRELSYPQWTPRRTAAWLKLPSLGVILLIALHFVYVIALEFVDVDPAMYGDQYYMALSVKAAWLAIAQMPLLILLAGKNNLVGLLTGVSYERLNVLHRWTARVLLLMATVHFGTESFVWNRFGLMQLEWATDTCPPTGIAAYALLLWLNLSTLAPLRSLSYEFFVVQHLLTFFGFIIALMMHLPTTALESRYWIYVPIGLYIMDRLLRFARYAWNNARGSRATLTPMEGGVTKIRVQNPRIKKWSPGSFVLLCLPRLSPGQSHPATIASTPDSHNGDLVFILKSHRGFTGTLSRVASEDKARLLDAEHGPGGTAARLALIDGPYGQHADFAAFDTTILVAGATGVTFTLPILLDMAHRATQQQLPVRHVHFLWLVKARACSEWVGAELEEALAKLRAAGVDTTVRVCVTCDDSMTDMQALPIRAAGCACDTRISPCCCVSIDEDDDAARSRSNSTDVRDSTTGTTSPGNEKAGGNQVGMRLTSGRPDLAAILWDHADEAAGEMGIAVCGPLGLNMCVRQTVAKLSDSRGVHKGTGAQGIFLHVEGFAM